MGKTGLLLFFALALCAMHYAYVLNVTVEDGFGTKLVATRVEALKGSTVAAAENADEHGVAQLSVAGGTYFIRLLRDGYPVQVLATIVDRDTAMKAVMNNKRETALLYGRILDNSTLWEGKSIYLLADWKIISTSKVFAEGTYIFPYVLPGSYSIRLNDGTPMLSVSEITLSPKEAAYLDISVVKPKPPEVVKDEPVELLAPRSVDVDTLIIVTLKKGETPLEGQKIVAATPSGQLELTTDSAGKAGINAAQAGKYVFTYEGKEALTQVQGTTPEVIPQAPIEQTPEAVPEQPQPPKQAPAQPGGMLAVAGIAFVAVALLAAAAIAGVFAYRRLMPPRYLPPTSEAKKEEGHAHGKKKRK